VVLGRGERPPDVGCRCADLGTLRNIAQAWVGAGEAGEMSAPWKVSSGTISIYLRACKSCRGGQHTEDKIPGTTDRRPAERR
jgi:hypothetical protein